MATVKRLPIEEIKGGTIILRFDKGGIPYNYYATGIPTDAVAGVKKTLESFCVKFAFIRDNSIVPEQKAREQEQETNVQTLISRIAKPKAAANEKLAAVKEVIAAQKVHTRAREIAKEVLSEVRLGKAVNTESSKTIVAELVDKCIGNPEIFVNMSRLKNFDDYTFTHSVNVSVLALSIGRRLGMGHKELTQLGLAGLLHDVGKMRVPESILNKPGKLTDEEFFVMKMHPVYGYELLKNDTNIPPEVVKAILQHHEKSDGTGYPYGLMEPEISRYAKILAISDVYDAITSERVYHKGMHATDALKMLFTWSGKHFNEVLVKFFINLIGIYPAGTAVILDTGELAVVFSASKESGMQPKVLIITDGNREMLETPVFFDLAGHNVVTGQPYKRILSPVNKSELQIDGNEIILQYINATSSSSKE